MYGDNIISLVFLQFLLKKRRQTKFLNVLFLTLFLFRIFSADSAKQRREQHSAKEVFRDTAKQAKKKRGRGTFSLFINLSLLGAERRGRRGWRYREAKRGGGGGGADFHFFPLSAAPAVFSSSSPFLLSLLSSPFPPLSLEKKSSPPPPPLSGGCSTTRYGIRQ